MSRRQALGALAAGGVLGAMAGLRVSHAGSASASDLHLKGNVVGRDSPDYEVQRQSLIWHLRKPDRYPALITNPANVADVQSCVRHARSHGMKVALRGSGHNGAYAALREGGMAINLSALADVAVDLDSQRAQIGPGVWSMDLMRTLGSAGLAFPVAHCGPVAMSGYLLGGGLGWNPDGWGIACNNVEAADIVLADGTAVRATQTENPDLLWAVRGAGPGFFGAVTSYKIKLFKQAATMRSRSFVHKLSDTGQAIEALLEASANSDRNVEVLALMMLSPEAPADAPIAERAILFTSVIAYADSLAQAHEQLAPFSSGPLPDSAIVAMPESDASFEQFFAPELVANDLGRYAVDNCWTNDPVGAMQIMADQFLKLPSPRSHILLSLKGDTRLRTDTAFSTIGRAYIGNYIVWDDPADDAANQRWLRESATLLAPLASGYYVNEIDGEQAPERFEACFSPESWARLRALRREYDPDGLFHDYIGLN